MVHDEGEVLTHRSHVRAHGDLASPSPERHPPVVVDDQRRLPVPERPGAPPGQVEAAVGVVQRPARVERRDKGRHLVRRHVPGPRPACSGRLDRSRDQMRVRGPGAHPGDPGDDARVGGVGAEERGVDRRHPSRAQSSRHPPALARHRRTPRQHRQGGRWTLVVSAAGADRERPGDARGDHRQGSWVGGRPRGRLDRVVPVLGGVDDTAATMAAEPLHRAHLPARATRVGERLTVGHAGPQQDRRQNHDHPPPVAPRPRSRRSGTGDVLGRRDHRRVGGASSGTPTAHLVLLIDPDVPIDQPPRAPTLPISC